MPQGTRTILVIGASGFVGRQVALELLALGVSVRCLARTPSRVQDLTDAGCEVVQGDILDAASVERALESVEAAYICVHTLSPQRANTASQDFMGVERTGLENIVRASRTHGVRRLVYVTSMGVAPEAPSTWLRGRWQTEQLLLDSGLDVTVLRPGMIVGRGGDGFGVVARGARNPVAIVLGSRTQRFRTIAVQDLAYYLVGVLDDPRSYGHHYDVGSDDVLTMDHMIDIAAQRLGRRPPVKIHVPNRILALAWPLVERFTAVPRGAVRGFVGEGQTVDVTGEPAPIRAILPRPPQSFAHMLERVLG